MDSPVDSFTEAQLASVNAAHPWDCCTLDGRGRRVGRPDGRLYEIPHRLVVMAEQWLGVKGRSVVEFGCLEGAQTISLCKLTDRVTAIDARPGNLVKTAVRTAIYGHFPTIKRVDVEIEPPPPAYVYFHAGVLYHLLDPVEHLRLLSRSCRCLLLDTHYTKEPRQSYTTKSGGLYRVEEKREEVAEIRAGMRSVSRWLTMDALKAVLGDGFSDVALMDDREERNGPRCTIVAKGGRGAS